MQLRLLRHDDFHLPLPMVGNEEQYLPTPSSMGEPMKTKTLEFFILILALSAGTSALAQDTICKDAGLTGRLLATCEDICVQNQCGSDRNIYTSDICVRSVDNYIEQSNGEMAPCIPKLSEGFQNNELYCYANWKVAAYNGCDPLFDPDSDVYEVVNEEDGVSPYELCSLNIFAQFEVCLTDKFLDAYSACNTTVGKSCYDDYALTNNYETLSTCLAAFQVEMDTCYQEAMETFYFKN